MSIYQSRRSFVPSAPFARLFDPFTLFDHSLFSHAFAGEDRRDLATPDSELRAQETEKELVFSVDLPRVLASDLEVTTEGNALSIRARASVSPPEGYRAVRQERGSYRFSRSLALPQSVDAASAKATLKDGVLTLSFAKREKEQPKKITIETL